MISRTCIETYTARQVYNLDEVIFSPGCDMYEGDYIKTNFSYDRDGNLISQTNLISTDGTEWNTILYDSKYEYIYDEKGNIYSEIELSGSSREFVSGIEWSATYMAEYSHNEKGDLASFTEYLSEGYDNGTQIWDPIRHISYSYQDNGKTINYDLTVNWDNEINQWEENSFSKHTQIYDDEGRMVEISEHQDIENLSYISASRIEIEYQKDLDFSSTTTFIKFGTENPWVVNKKTEYEYDEKLNLVLVYEIAYDLETGEDNESKTTEKYAYEYDEKGRITAKIIFGPPYGGDEWVEKSRYVFEYDENDLTTVESGYKVDNNYYVETGQVDSLILIEQKSFVFDDHGNKIEQINMVWSDKGKSMVENTRTIYTYDYNITRRNFKTQFKSLKVPDIFDNPSVWNLLMEYLLFEDRVLVEETIYQEYEDFENDQGETETRWLNPCTQEYVYSRFD